MVLLFLSWLAVLASVSEASVRTDLNGIEIMLQRVNRQILNVGSAVRTSCASCGGGCPECFRNVAIRDLSEDLDELMDSFQTIRGSIGSCSDQSKTVMWSGFNGEVISVEDSTGTVTTFNQAGIRKVEYDDAIGRIIYTDNTGMVFSNLPDGSDPIMLDDLTAANRFFGMAVISANKYMFGGGNLYKYDNGVTTIINSDFDPAFFRLSYNPTDGYVYAASVNLTPAIYRVDCDGNVEIAYRTNPANAGVTSIAVDVSAQVVYFTERIPRTLSKYNLNTGVETFVLDLRADITDIHIEGDSLYIAFDVIGVIEEVSLVSGSVVREVLNVPTAVPTVAAWIE
ncbi:uncharacterized protein LOC124118884 [Haliotis rufescens]|uniref:uncharacterized protein LOC124118884 n=1 Tax=Haliotis rufescens TaxID=6454 RepID=UPI00201F216B|nr:uncharacterized protein LOC124118884 [Haliotis rufescens]